MKNCALPVVLIFFFGVMVPIAIFNRIAPEPDKRKEWVSFPTDTTSGIFSVTNSDYLYARIPKDCAAVIEIVATSSVQDAVKRFDVYCESIPNPSTP